MDFFLCTGRRLKICDMSSPEPKEGVVKSKKRVRPVGTDADSKRREPKSGERKHGERKSSETIEPKPIEPKRARVPVPPAEDEEIKQCEPLFEPTPGAVLSAFIPNPQQLNNVCRVLKSVLETCPFLFVPDGMPAHEGVPSREEVDQLVPRAPGMDAFVGIALQCTSHSLTAIVIARFACVVYRSPEAQAEDLCAVVDMPRLAAAIASRGADESLEIFRRRGENFLRIKSGKSSSGQATYLSTIDSDPTKTCFVLKSMVVEFTVEIDTAELIKMTKLATSHEVDWVSMHLSREGSTIYLALKIKGDTSGDELTYKSVASRQLNSNVTCFSISEATIGPPSKLLVNKAACEPLYDESFAVTHIRTFAAGAPTRTVLMRFTSGKPLIMTSMFGDTQGNMGPSFVSQVLAPQLKSEDDLNGRDFFS
jgi:hypothetical protein